jgi:hypothetical protein
MPARAMRFTGRWILRPLAFRTCSCAPQLRIEQHIFVGLIWDEG